MSGVQAQSGEAVTLIVATHNEGKLVEINRILSEDLKGQAQRITLRSAASLGLPDPVETGVSFEGNALLKARDVARRTNLPALADDSGLIVDVLGAAPGILSARWAGAHGHDKANNALLLAQIEDIPDGKRGARFVCATALVIPGEEERSFVRFGEMKGSIIRKARGEQGFGYDPIFVPDDQPDHTDEDGLRLTSAQMSTDEKNAISHRGKALKAITSVIAQQLL
ncbi:MAG: RdgB/HAM1 family non-canonical purine NTP pyrophosphatase [Bifidobacterium psychraerophilum]|uniref:RdgB/HAM1 family non-canonical purine NTP pyrophosphatase n=1 Tax=Bifidobacterium psychraerophilum TaxID=218140 RepID=UPI0039EC9A42